MVGGTVVGGSVVGGAVVVGGVVVVVTNGRGITVPVIRTGCRAASAWVPTATSEQSIVTAMSIPVTRTSARDEASRVNRTELLLLGQPAAVLLSQHPLAHSQGLGCHFHELVLGDELDGRLEGE
ncbi:MAG: hypothetical protein QOC92_3956 [Acidimicrobiaceae bacterium]